MAKKNKRYNVAEHTRTVDGVKYTISGHQRKRPTQNPNSGHRPETSQSVTGHNRG